MLFKKKEKDEAPIDRELIETFVQAYKPGNDLKKPDKKLLKLVEDILPPEILYLWENYGFGDYGDGLLKVIDPRDYWDNLAAWLGRKDMTRVPIMMTAFGDLFYYRKLEQGEHDIALLDIHFRKTTVCAWSLPIFLKGYLQDKDIRHDILRDDIFADAVQKLGALRHNEIFFFVPALCLGGFEDIKHVGKGDAEVHQVLLLQLGKKNSQ